MKHHAKQGFTFKVEYTPHLPNEFHRQAKWSGAKVQKNLKKYDRKRKVATEE